LQLRQRGGETRRIIDEDGHDSVCSYGMDYDYIQHRKGPESAAALTALQQQTARFGRPADHIRKVWAHRNTPVVLPPITAPTPWVTAAVRGTMAGISPRISTSCTSGKR